MWPGIPDSYQKLPASHSASFRIPDHVTYQTPTRHALLGSGSSWKTHLKAGMAHSTCGLSAWVAGKTVWSSLTRGCVTTKHLLLLQWSVAVSMIRRQRTRSLAFLQAEWILIFADCTSASIPLSQYVGALEVSSSLFWCSINLQDLLPSYTDIHTLTTVNTSNV